MKQLFERLSTRFRSADELFQARPVRERIMLGAMSVGLVIFAIDTIAIQPLSAENKRVEIANERARTRQASLQSELAILSHNEPSPEEQRIAIDIEQVRRQLVEIDRQISAEIEALVSPEAIVSVLDELLSEDPGLRLVRLESQPPRRIGGDTPDRSISIDGVSNLYLHGVRIEIEGTFAATLDYLERIESSPWNLIWDQLDYRVNQYPTATVTIDLHTISQREEWIGV